MAEIGRNQPCPCGSGKKYKRCRGSDAFASAGSVSCGGIDSTAPTGTRPSDYCNEGGRSSNSRRWKHDLLFKELENIPGFSSQLHHCQARKGMARGRTSETCC